MEINPPILCATKVDSREQQNRAADGDIKKIIVLFLWQNLTIIKRKKKISRANIIEIKKTSSGPPFQYASAV